MKKKWLLLFVWVFILGSCEKYEDQQIPAKEKQEYVVLKERDPNYPWVPVQRTGLSRSAPTSLGFKDCVGRSLKFNTFPIENLENLGYPVIDMDKLTKDYPSYYTSWRIGNQSAESFSYSSFDRFLENSSTTKKISGGFSLNLGIFKIGAKKKMTEVFSKSYVENNRSVFGMLSILVKDSCFNLQVSSNIKKKIKSDYLHKTFKDELYNTTPDEFFSNYGAFVLSRYITGGKALGYYCGFYKESETVEAKEKDMNKEIAASFGTKRDSASMNLGIGKGFTNGSTSTNKFSSLWTSVQTVGGATGSIGVSIPQDINTINVDLSDWMKSLNDKTNHSIIDVLEDGLIPITDFIVEENLKNAMLDIYKNGIGKIAPLQEPYILFSQWTGTVAGVGWFTYLVTRFGDKILLRETFANPANNFPKSIEDEVQRISSMFGLKIVHDLNLDGFQDAVSGPSYTEQVLFDAFNENKMTKFINNQDKTIYLLYSDGDNRYAYSIHYNRLLTEYVMKDFVNRLPIANIDLQTILDKYYIVAL